VLIHDTQNQSSLLTDLGANTIALTSSCFDITSRIQPGTRARMSNGIGRFEIGPGGVARYYPKLGNGMFRYDLPVGQWWNQTIFILDPDTWVTRKDVVMSAADKDGGAHVDAKLTPVDERLVQSGDLGYFVDEQSRETPLTGHHYVALRQMGHELLDSPALLTLGNNSQVATKAQRASAQAQGSAETIVDKGTRAGIMPPRAQGRLRGPVS
jgi:hypothetical protein